MKKNTLCVIPARSRSKGVIDKNIKKINNISLIGHAIDCAIKTKIFSEIVISTDSENYGREAQKWGAKFFFKRSKKLSKSFIGDIEVIYDALNRSEKEFKRKFNYIAMLQPTCPTRKPKHIIKTFKNLLNNNLDTVWTVSEIDKKFHPLKILKICKNKNFKNYISQGKKIIARQQLNNLFIRNGACYFFSRDTIKNKDLYGKKNGLEILKDEMVNIDSQQDLIYARNILRKNK